MKATSNPLIQGSKLTPSILRITWSKKQVWVEHGQSLNVFVSGNQIQISQRIQIRANVYLLKAFRFTWRRIKNVTLCVPKWNLIVNNIEKNHELFSFNLIYFIDKGMACWFILGLVASTKVTQNATPGAGLGRVQRYMHSGGLNLIVSIWFNDKVSGIEW